ncbi:MAG: esterase-like activity of phytase family protein [Acidobacteria bacterium]|nr:esterase-like activity of phytase family protein [Acidobacteriota bacterium]
MRLAAPVCAAVFLSVPHLHAQQFPLLAVGELNDSRAGAWADVSGLTYTLENGVPANNLGGFGSAITYAGGNEFLALPDRGPNAVPFNPAVDDTVAYVNRFHTVHLNLTPNHSGSGLPFELKPLLQQTTLLWSATPLVYGNVNGSGVPPINGVLRYYFTGRSDGFDAKQNSGDPNDARFDTEGIRVSNDGKSVFISDEYGPYIYQFDRNTGVRLRTFALPASFYVTNLSAVGATEISGNTAGRTANKGMEGLAITPDGKTLVGVMQASLIQDAAQKGAAAKLLRLVTIDIASGQVTGQYAYGLTTGSGVSEILALNNHEFLVDERDGHGRADGSLAVVKQLFKIDLTGATDVSGMDGKTAATHEVAKTLFVDLVASMNKAGISSAEIPAKIEGICFGPDLRGGGETIHTLWVANDNDFSETVLDPDGNTIANPNQFFVFGFRDTDLGGSAYVPQFQESRELPAFLR